MNTPLYPLRFAPIFRPVLWGGYRIAPYKGILSEPRAIGESWELSPMEGHTSVVLEGALPGILSWEKNITVATAHAFPSSSNLSMLEKTYRYRYIRRTL